MVFTSHLTCESPGPIIVDGKLVDIWRKAVYPRHSGDSMVQCTKTLYLRDGDAQEVTVDGESSAALSKSAVITRAPRTSLHYPV